MAPPWIWNARTSEQIDIARGGERAITNDALWGRFVLFILVDGLGLYYVYSSESNTYSIGIPGQHGRTTCPLIRNSTARANERLFFFFDFS